jgi:hypothetical protein
VLEEWYLPDVEDLVQAALEVCYARG